MKPLKEALISKNKRDWATIPSKNKYGITKKDMIGGLKGFPVGIVVRMLEEQEKQENKPDVKVFQKNLGTGQYCGGFEWDYTEDEWLFWSEVISKRNFKEFYKRYPEYKKYDDQ